tara:strand:+ start:194 stop:343 length:150 start_codon:yes stop_codon:yes gene_type:complete
MNRIEKVKKILEKLLYESREDLSAYGIDEILDVAITNLDSEIKERNTNE